MASFVISYDRVDRPFVERLVYVIQRDHHDVWFDRDINYGEPFAKVIRREIDRCDEVIVLWSEASVDSTWVENEAAYALSKKKLRPACLPGLSVNDLPLGFFTLNTFVFESDEDKYLKQAVRSFLSKNALGRAFTNSTQDNQLKAASNTQKSWLRKFASIPIVVATVVASWIAGDLTGHRQSELKAQMDSAEDAFMDSFHQISGQQSCNDPIIGLLENTHQRMFPKSSRMTNSSEIRTIYQCTKGDKPNNEKSSLDTEKDSLEKRDESQTNPEDVRDPD